jgi:hypothetical protein
MTKNIFEIPGELKKNQPENMGWIAVHTSSFYPRNTLKTEIVLQSTLFGGI